MYNQTSNRYLLFPVALTLLVITFMSMVLASDLTKKTPEDLMTREEVEAYLRFLASDELEGRETGTRGNDVAARYIAEQFRSFGVKAPTQFPDYLQPVPMKRVSPPSDQNLEIFGRKLQPREDFILVASHGFDIESDAIDAGYGLEGELSLGIEDERSLSGKVAIVRYGSENRGSPMGLSKEKGEFLSSIGAQAVVELYSGNRWNRYSGFINQSRLALNTYAAKSDGRIPYILVNDSDGKLLDFLENNNPGRVKLNVSEKAEEQVLSSNVIGLIEGTDPNIRDEYLILSAHFDHLGSREGSGDTIYNGARDNGMGTAAVIAAARAFAQDPPARSILFIGFTAEEKGLLGSSHYVNNPLVPLDQTVFVLNNDGAGYDDVTKVTILGFNRTTASDQIEEGCQDFGLQSTSGGPQVQRLFNNSDNRAFAQKGVPAVTFSPGFSGLNQEIRKYYHQLNDHADENFDFDYLLRFTQAYIRSARYLANEPKRPKWAKGDPYEKAAQTLYTTSY